MVYQLLRDPYLDPDTGVMRNRLGITDADELEQDSRTWTPGDQAALDHTYSAIHPFREGNGRTIRLLLSLLANRYHWDLQWQHTTAEHNQHACALAFYGDETELREMMRRVGSRISP